METGTQLGISTVMAGQILEDVHTGAETVATADLVLFSILTDGEQTACCQMSADQALAVAAALTQAAGKLIKLEITDDGHPLSFAARMARLNKGLSA